MPKNSIPVLTDKTIQDIADRAIASMSDLIGPKRRPPSLMQLFNVGFVEAGIRVIWEKLKEEYTYKDEIFYDIVDWCIIEMFDEYVSQNNIRVSGHRDYDEGRVVYEYLESEKRDLFYHLDTTGINQWQTGYIKVMVLGREAIVARPSPMQTPF